MLTYFTTILEMPVPIAVIVCEGDIDTIVHISEALKNKLPVIIMKGSGKAADLVFDFLENERQLKKRPASYLVSDLMIRNIVN